MKNQKGFAPIIIVVIVLAVCGGGVVAYHFWWMPSHLASSPTSSPTPGPIVSPTPTPISSPTVSPTPTPTEIGEIKTLASIISRFAEWQDVSVDVEPKVPSYSVKSDLSDIINKDDFEFSSKAKELLVKNAFVVVPESAKEFFSLYDLRIYEENRYHNVPNFITTDSMLHNYHLAFDHLLRVIEKEKLVEELTNLTYEMVKASKAQYQTLKGAEWENAAKRNIAFFVVANKLLYPEAKIPEYVKDEAEKELDLIEKHESIALSPIINMGIDPLDPNLTEEEKLGLYKEDYSQYIPRGHYTKDEDLKKYFKAMMYLGRLTFRLKKEDETRSAVLMTLSLKESDLRYKSWEKIYEPTVFFVGKSDDINFYDYDEILKEVYGTENVGLSVLTADNKKFNSFLEKTKKLSPPQINSMPIWDARFQPDREKEIKGFRFMGQRFTIDASIFQRLMYREVGDKEHTCEDGLKKWSMCPPFGASRCLPKALDIPAAMGLEEASNILKKQGEFGYACYTENMTKMKEHIAGLPKTIWTQNLYWGWLYSLLPLGREMPEGYPAFMKSLAWIHKELNTFLGSWTELKRDTILYTKQPYAELGAGLIEKEEVDDRGYVEPNPHLYGRLASLIKLTKEGLEERELLEKEDKNLLDRMEVLALSLKIISEKELNNVLPTDEEFNLIRTYGGSLEHIWLAALKDRGIGTKNQLHEEPAAVVADVATNPNGLVLEEGTGDVAKIYVVVPVEGKLRIAVGGVYTHYEFEWPTGDRLTDEKWREILKGDKAPALADWTSSFITQ